MTYKMLQVEQLYNLKIKKYIYHSRIELNLPLNLRHLASSGSGYVQNLNIYFFAETEILIYPQDNGW